MSKKTSPTEKAAQVLSVAAAVAAAAAGYYFYGKGGTKHRKSASAWTKKAKLEMLKKIKAMKTVTKAAYNKAAEETAAKYKEVKNISPEELKNFGQELKTHWEEISKEAANPTNKGPTKKTAAKL